MRRVERVWELWADPRKLERWWGPPTHPATFDARARARRHRHLLHDQPGGRALLRRLALVAVDPPRSLDVEDSFADADGNVNPDMPTGQMHMRLTEEDGRTRMELISVNATKEAMQQLLDMGAAEGMQQAIGQMDALLAE